VYMASHELRTPMTAIKNYLWLALNKHQQNLDENLRTDLNRAYISTERLIRLVQDMLTVSRIEGNRLVFDIKDLDIGQLAQQIIDELSVSAKEKNISLSLRPTEEKYMARADDARISEVFQNLIGNALKFTPAGGSITVSMKRNNSMIEISVSDTGVGIPAQDIGRLFQKFGRLGHSYERLKGETGTGLGLFISKQIVEAHGGKIWVTSVEDQGSTFTFSLPAVNPAGISSAADPIAVNDNLSSISE
jgi:signal transduction histidine kinase